MEFGVYDEQVSSGEEIYVDSFDDSIEQSSVYDKIYFECVKRELPAIVLTPYCDILHPDGELFLTVCGLFPATIVFESFLKKKGLSQNQLAGIETISPSKYKGFSKEFSDHYLKNRVLEYHFFPAYKDKLSHCFADFQFVATLPARELGEKMKMVVLKSPWRESVPSRYAAYSLRVGVKPFTDGFLQSVMEDVSTLSATL